MLNLNFIGKNEKVVNIDTFNMLSVKSGEEVKNQYIIEVVCTDYENLIEYKIFKSYNSFICCTRNGRPVMLWSNYNYSVTTGKYLNAFLRQYTCFENVKQILKEYNLLENGELRIKKGGEK